MVFFYTYPTLLQRLLRPKLLGLSPVAQTLSNHRELIYWMENVDLVGIQLQQIAQYPPPDPTAYSGLAAGSSGLRSHALAALAAPLPPPQSTNSLFITAQH